MYFFFFNDTATTEIYTLSLHDALPILAKVCHSCGKKPSFGNARSHSLRATRRRWNPNLQKVRVQDGSTTRRVWVDRKSTRLNSSHANISYAVFCLKKKNTQ